MVIDMSADNFPTLQDEIKHAIALADATARDDAEWQARQLVRRSVGQDLIYKVHEPSSEKGVVTADTFGVPQQTQAADDFVTREDVTQMLEVAMEIAGEESGKLERRIIELEREVERLKGSNVTPMRGKDAAAA
jgi:hypothetical protein